MSAYNLRVALDFFSRPIGLALSGGSVRGIAHIGVLKALTERGIGPAFVVGTSVGSLIGAAIASGMDWQEIKRMAEAVFWPSLLNGGKLERFCCNYLPSSFADLKLPFAAVATTIPGKRTVVIKAGKLATAISASCAVRVVRRPVPLHGAQLKDGGISCVLPSLECRGLGAQFIIGSDVWEFSALLRGFGLAPNHPRAHRVYPRHFLHAVQGSDILIQPDIPISVYLPGYTPIDALIAAGEKAAIRALGVFN